VTYATEAPKARLADLAVLGGPPAFTEALHVGRPNVGDRARLHARIDELLDRRWLTNDGPLALELEERIAVIAGVRHCVATANATVALEVAIRALGLTGEVIVPAFTFVATAHALAWQGIEPVFCDIDPRTHTLDPAAVERAIGPRTTGIMGVHLWGRACATDALSEIAESHGLRLLFDAAHALGCSHMGRPIGGFGAVSVFSLHATKFVNSGEGGIIATDDGELAAAMRSMKNFGFVDYDDVRRLGTNGKMSELAAATGLTSLEGAGQFIAVNRRHHDRYRTALDGVPGLTLLDHEPAERSNFHYVVAEIDAGVTGLHRDQLLRTLHAENVLARRYFYPGCHRMEPYRSAGRRWDLPVTERLADRVLVLPTGTSLDAGDVDRVAAIVRLALTHGRELSASLGGGSR
jgi:dTDP-4-amino-4,6-dideoxygalactose transaminase